MMYLEEIEKNINSLDEEIENNNIKIKECQDKLANIDNTKIMTRIMLAFVFASPLWVILVLFLPKISLVIPAKFIPPLMFAISLPFGTIAAKIYNKRKGYSKTTSNEFDIRANILLEIEKNILNSRNKILYRTKKKLSSKADFYKKIMENKEFIIKPRKISLTEEEIRNINDEIEKNSKKIDSLTNNIAIRSLMNTFSFDFDSVSTFTIFFVIECMIPTFALSLPLGYILVLFGLSVLVPMTLSTIILKIKNHKSMCVLNKVIEDLKNEGIDIDLETGFSELMNEREDIIENIVESKCQLLLANIDEDNSELKENDEANEKEYVVEQTEKLSIDNQCGPRLTLK